MNIKQLSWIIGALLCSSVAIAQVKVVESSSDPQRGKSSRSNPQTEMFLELQRLQREVMDLRGQLEEQAYQIKKLTKQRKDDYVNLDERISALSGRKTEARSRSDRLTADSSASEATANLPTGDPAAEAKVYKAAYALVKNQQFDEALSAFDDFILLYPSGEYAPNAHYWLGELYLYKSDLPQAIKEFNVIVDDYPQHRKAPDAMFKLAKAHHVKGDIETARSMLNRVISDYQQTDSKAPKLARDYLNNMLQ